MLAVPGYEGIGRVGFSDKGDYSAGKVYKAGDVVFSEGSSYLALKDNLQGVKPQNDGENWRFMARGFGAELLSGVMALDQSGLIGSTGESVNAQDLMDAIADKVATKLLLKTDVVNQIVNDANKAASAAALYSVKQTVDEVNSDFGKTLKIVESGFSVFSNVPAKGSATNDVTFTGRYDINPFIIVSPASVGCKLIPAASYRRNTGFKLEVSNPFDTANYGEIRWFAVM